MVEKDLKSLVLGVIGLYLDELNDNDVDVDQDFLDDLGQALEAEGLRQGLDPGLAARLKQLAGEELSLELELDDDPWSAPPAHRGRSSEAIVIH